MRGLGWRGVWLLAAAVGFLACGEPSVDYPPGALPSGMTAEEFPIALGASWVYQEQGNPQNQYRITVEGTRMIAGEVNWKLVYTQLDAAGNPLIGQPPPPSDYYAANGLHLRFTAVSRTPGVYVRAVFVGGVKAAAVEPFPVGAVYGHFTMNPTQVRVKGDPIRYDEFTQGTLGAYFEVASEGLALGQLHFQEHVPPRRFWEFPLTVGRRWIVFQTQAISRGALLDPQPPIRAERMVVGEVSVQVPAYSGRALVVDEWVTGLKTDPDTGELIVPPLEDTNGDGVPERGLPTARYWVAPGVGVVQYEYEFVDLGPPPAFTHKTFVLTRFSIPTSED